MSATTFQHRSNCTMKMALRYSIAVKGFSLDCVLTSNIALE